MILIKCPVCHTAHEAAVVDYNYKLFCGCGALDKPLFEVEVKQSGHLWWKKTAREIRVLVDGPEGLTTMPLPRDIYSLPARPIVPKHRAERRTDMPRRYSHPDSLKWDDIKPKKEKGE